jgi:tetratricopeptide (TPR) repeat protein
VEVSLASGLEVVRTLSFADRDDEALALLAELEESFPDEPMLQAWRRRVQRKQADYWFEVARSAMASSQFEAARLAYERAISFEPDHALAPAGLARVELLEEYRADLAEDYYFNGVRDLTEQRLDESENSFEKSRRYDAESTRTRRRIVEVRREKAQGRVAYAEQLVADRRYAAARAEYAEASRLDPESEAIAAALDAMRVEAEVAALLSEAESFVLRSEFAEAELLIAEAGERTTLQADLVEAARDGISATRVQLLYQRALDLEHDFLFTEAIELYGEVLSGRDFYEDARARKEALETYVVEAARLYAEAQAATAPADKLAKLRQIETFWPEYEDILDQISALEDE